MKLRTTASLIALATAVGLGSAVHAQTNQQPTQPTQQQAQPGDQQDKNGNRGARQVEGQIETKEPDMVLVSNLWNANVYGSDEKRIGDVNDIIIKSDGKIEGVVVGVGGFLGLGEKNVALKLDRFKVMPEADGRARIVVSANKEELQEAPEFKTKQDQGSQQQKPQQQGKSDGSQPKS
jgi:sporulation protein YlmC with PRC-barrel domain